MNLRPPLKSFLIFKRAERANASAAAAQIEAAAAQKEAAAAIEGRGGAKRALEADARAASAARGN